MGQMLKTSQSCPNCDTLFEDLPVEFDEDGGYAVLEVQPCAHPGCGKLLCPCCAQFHCDGCGMVCCAEHMVSVEDGTERPLHLCPSCAAEETQAVCPVCGSDFLVFEEFQSPIDRETGYHDSGEMFRCNACGASGDASDCTMVAETPAVAPARIGPGRETARPRVAEASA